VIAIKGFHATIHNITPSRRNPAGHPTFLTTPHAGRWTLGHPEPRSDPPGLLSLARLEPPAPSSSEKLLDLVLVLCSYPPMSDAATTPVAAVKPDPHRAEPVPPCIAHVLSLVHALFAYGRNLAETLQQHAAAPYRRACLEFVATTFGTGDLALALARITRGLLRAAALETRLRRRAATGRDIKPTETPLPGLRTPCTAKPAVPPGGELPQDPSLDRPPTTEEIIAKDRRRPIGAVLVDICLDLGIKPGPLMGRATAEQLRMAIGVYGGSLARLLCPESYKRRPAAPRRRVRRKTPDLFREPAPDLIRGHSATGDSPSPSGSASLVPIPPANPIAAFPTWPARSPQSPAPAGTGPP
jgi:hypothetical protein